MKQSMYWFDDNKKNSLQEKIIKAINYFQQKYGEKPNICSLHPSMLESEKDVKVVNLRINPCDYILPNHLLLEND